MHILGDIYAWPLHKILHPFDPFWEVILCFNYQHACTQVLIKKGATYNYCKTIDGMTKVPNRILTKYYIFTAS